MRLFVAVIPGVLVLTAAAYGQTSPGVTITGPTALSVGNPVNWTAQTQSNSTPGQTSRRQIDYQYRWEVIQNNTTIVFRDFNTVPSISWIPTHEGPGTLIVIVRNPNTLATQTAAANLNITWPAGAQAVSAVTGTPNPLTAIYRSPCQYGLSVRAQFAPSGMPMSSGMSTSLQSCTGQTTTFVIAGMKASTPYNIASVDSQGNPIGAQVAFTTGVVPATVQAIIPSVTLSSISTAPERVILQSFIQTDTLPAAYDRDGSLIWYNQPTAEGGIAQLLRSLPGGYLVFGQQNGLLQEIDLLGNIVRETNIARVTEQLAASPYNSIVTGGVSRIADFNHDAFLLPDGNIGTLSIVERLADQHDGKGVVDVLGTAVLVLDPQWQIAWAWDPFLHLDINRKATLNDTCASYTVGCPQLKLVPSGGLANDWMHANSIMATSDGNLLLSIRDQDWIVKLDYSGRTGNVIWRFGQNGDFTASGDSSEPVLFPSHQHDASLLGSRLLMFDNANGTHASLNGSRGEVWSINEAMRTAHLDVDARMNNYSSVVGSARQLMNGDYYFLAGFIDSTYSQSIEFSGGAAYATPAVTFTFSSQAYRSFRMTDLYTPSN